MILYKNYVNSWVALPHLRSPVIQRMYRKLGMESISRLCQLNGTYYGAKLREII